MRTESAGPQPARCWLRAHPLATRTRLEGAGTNVAESGRPRGPRVDVLTMAASRLRVGRAAGPLQLAVRVPVLEGLLRDSFELHLLKERG